MSLEITGKNTVDILHGKPVSEEDAQLLEFLKESAPKIAVVGTGGAGSNTINRMSEVGIEGALVIAMNTDAQHLLGIKARKKLLLGKKKTRGLGAGSNPEVGEAAAEESIDEIRELLKGYDLVFVTCGLGGGTGTGSAHVISRAVKEAGGLSVGVCTLPFTSEGPKRMKNAMIGLEKLKTHADTVIVIPNDKLLHFVADLPLNSAFKTSDMILTNSVKGITELITKPGLVNLDFADIRTILSSAGTAMIGLGEVGTKEQRDRVVIAAEKALSSPLLDLDITQADKALINITGGSDMTLGEAEAAVQAISSRISKDAHVIWGAAIDNDMDDTSVRVLAVITGIKDSAKIGVTQIQVEETEPIDLDFL
ncbi:MAG: cell division protein FtsZ [Candidatus Micrarchaeota archaeon]